MLSANVDISRPGLPTSLHHIACDTAHISIGGGVALAHVRPGQRAAVPSASRFVDGVLDDEPFADEPAAQSADELADDEPVAGETVVGDAVVDELIVGNACVDDCC